MKQLIFKELREQFKVALIGLAVLTLMLFLVFNEYANRLRQTLENRGSGYDDLQVLLKPALLIQAAFFCGLFGLLLGWLQIRAEKHPDLRAFLVHRPIARSRIVWSKVVAGVLLYFAGAGLPLLGLALVAATPGNVAAPFEWGMALPLAAILLTGVAYYFAGMLTALRQARWFASRGFGLGPAVLASLCVFVLPEFWHSLSVTGLAGLLLVLAVRGAFQTGGFYRDQPWICQAGMTAAATVSSFVLLGVTVTFVINLFITRGGYDYSYYRLLKDGNVVRVTRAGLAEPVITDLAGQPARDAQTGQLLSAQEVDTHSMRSHHAFAPDDAKGRNQLDFADRFTQSARYFSPWRVQAKTLWFLSADGRLVAYDGITRRASGVLAPKGAADDTRFLRLPSYRYGAMSYDLVPGVLTTARTAYVVDLEKRELKPLLTVADGDSILGGSSVSSTPAPASVLPPPSVLLLTRTSIRLMELDGATKLLLPYAPDPRQYPSVEVHAMEATNRFAVRLDPSYLENQRTGGKLLSHVRWVNADGTIDRELQLPKLPEIVSDQRMEQVVLTLLPPVLRIGVQRGGESTRSERWWHFLRFVPAIFCAGVGWWLGGRHQFTLKARVGWALFNLLFGVSGLLAFLAVQEWPAKETCPACDKLREVDREKCEHCGAEFAPPELAGTEIFEPLVKT